MLASELVTAAIVSKQLIEMNQGDLLSEPVVHFEPA